MTDLKNYLGQGKEERLEMAYRKFCCENKYQPYDKNDKSFFTTGDKKDIPHSMAWCGFHEEDVSGYSWEGEEDEVEVEEWEGENLMLATYDYDNDYPCIIFTEEGEQVGFFPPGKWSMNNYDKKKAHFFEYGVYRDEGEKPWEEPHWLGQPTWENWKFREEMAKFYKVVAENM